MTGGVQRFRQGRISNREYILADCATSKSFAATSPNMSLVVLLKIEHDSSVKSQQCPCCKPCTFDGSPIFAAQPYCAVTYDDNSIAMQNAIAEPVQSI
jgi:hypothetical protein